MIADFLKAFVGTQGSRPLSVAIAVASLIAPGTLVIYLARPALFWRLGLPTAAAMSAVVSLPLQIISYGIFQAPLSALRRSEMMPENRGREPKLLQVLTADDPTEWPCLLAGSWLTTWVLYVVAAVAYLKPIRIGLTLLLVAGILAFVWLLSAIVTGVVFAPADDASEPAT